MALLTRTYPNDDLGLSESDVSTVRFALDKASDETDLSAANEARLRDKLAKFLDAATEVKNTPATGEDGRWRWYPAPGPTRNKLRRSVSGPGPAGVRSPTVDVSPRRSRKRSVPPTRSHAWRQDPGSIPGISA